MNGSCICIVKVTRTTRIHITREISTVCYRGSTALILFIYYNFLFPSLFVFPPRIYFTRLCNSVIVIFVIQTFSMASFIFFSSYFWHKLLILSCPTKKIEFNSYQPYSTLYCVRYNLPQLCNIQPEYNRMKNVLHISKLKKMYGLQRNRQIMLFSTMNKLKTYTLLLMGFPSTMITRRYIR